MEKTFSPTLPVTFAPNICRLCGVTKTRGLNVYSTAAKRTGLLSKINKRLSKEVVHIVAGDGLPKFICFECQAIINNFTEFCSVVQNVQTKLLKEKDVSNKRRQFISGKIVVATHDLQITESNKNLPTVRVGPDGKVECLICQTFLDAAEHTTLHMVTHGIGTVLCQCRTCGQEGELSVFQHTNGEQGSVYCKMCRTLSSKKKRQNTNLKSFSCQACSKTFRSRGHLQRHSLIHSGLKPYLCEICGTGFSQRSSLKFHVMSHMGTNPFKCQQCGQTFRFKVSLQSHISTVHGTISEHGREYECDRCGKVFVTVYKLRRHYRCHTGERPYECKRCGRLFSQTGNLKLHCKKHEDEEAEEEMEENSSDTTFQESAINSYVVPLLRPHNSFVEQSNDVDPKFLDTILQEHSLTLLNKNTPNTFASSQFNSPEYLPQTENTNKKGHSPEHLYTQYDENDLLFIEQPDTIRTSESVALPTFSSLQSNTL